MQRFRPNANIEIKEDGIVAKIDLPGVDRDDIDVEIVNDNLEVRIEKLTERKEGREDAYIVEQFFSGYFQRIPIPSDADIDNAEADYDGEKLTVTIPLLAEGQAGEIGRDFRVAQEIREDWRQQAPPSERATQARPEESSTEEELKLREETLSRTAPAQDQPIKKEATVVSPVAGGYGMRPATEVERREEARGEPRAQETTREEMMKREQYPPGTGSYYSESRERPIESAAPEAYFGEGSPRKETETGKGKGAATEKRSERKKVNVK